MYGLLNRHFRPFPFKIVSTTRRLDRNLYKTFKSFYILLVSCNISYFSVVFSGRRL